MQSIEWRPILGYEGFYDVSSDGKIRSIGRGIELRQSLTVTGNYFQVKLSKNGLRKTFRVHRLVALAFHGKPNDGDVARHLDGNSHNNSADNLAWGTVAQNVEDSRRHGTLPPLGFCKQGHNLAVDGAKPPRKNGFRECKKCAEKRMAERYERVYGPRTRVHTKLSDDAVAMIRQLAADGVAARALAEQFGISKRYTNTLIAQKKRPTVAA